MASRAEFGPFDGYTPRRRGPARGDRHAFDGRSEHHHLSKPHKPKHPKDPTRPCQRVTTQEPRSRIDGLSECRAIASDRYHWTSPQQHEPRRPQSTQDHPSDANHPLSKNSHLRDYTASGPSAAAGVSLWWVAVLTGGPPGGRRAARSRSWATSTATARPRAGAGAHAIPATGRSVTADAHHNRRRPPQPPTPTTTAAA